MRQAEIAAFDRRLTTDAFVCREPSNESNSPSGHRLTRPLSRLESLKSARNSLPASKVTTEQPLPFRRRRFPSQLDRHYEKTTHYNINRWPLGPLVSRHCPTSTRS